MAKRNRGTGIPDPTKDRSAHEGARGVKKVSLNDLARQIPSEHELDEYLTHIENESDRGAAVMAAALVERALEDRIRSSLIDPGDGTQDTWFEGRNAPFSTFSAKISLARALGIIDADIEAMLLVLKNVRNAFAHTMKPITFAHPTIKAECESLKPTVGIEVELAARAIFATSCLTLARLLGMNAILRSKVGAQIATGREGGPK